MATILTCYYRPKPGGLCTRYFRAIRALLARGHVVHYLAVVRFPIEHERCHFHRFPWPAGATHGLAFWAVFHLLAPWMLLFIALRHGVDRGFVFATNYGFLMQLARIFRRFPLALFLRADVLRNHRLMGRASWLIVVETFIERIAIRGACVFGVSQTLTHEVARRHRAPSGTRFATLTNEIGHTVNRAPRDHAQLRFASVGVLEPRKNVEILVRAFSLNPAPNAHLTIYGDGPRAASLKELVADLRLLPRIEFAGWVDNRSIWAETEVLLFPSLHEGFPNAVCEALAHEIPVWASDIPEHRELLPIDYLVPASAQAWAHVIDVAMDPGARDRARRAQADHAQRYRFDWDAAAVAAILECPLPIT